MIRIGKITFKYGKRQYPSYPGFVPIEVMTSSKDYSLLSPYHLRDNNNFIMENIWQFTKVYREVPESKQFYSNWDKTVIWDHPKEVHYNGIEEFNKDNLTEEYFKWRMKGLKNRYAVRYPVGRNHRHECMGLYMNGNLYNYIDARKEVYLPLYISLLDGKEKFVELLDILKKGTNILLMEVDGPDGSILDYYKRTYDVEDNFIENNTMLATKENLTIMLNDSKKPFGHGYCLAVALKRKIDGLQLPISNFNPITNRLTFKQS
jgi:hypothetical protein